jgi:Fe-S cluster biogenesis protein NfuA
VLSTAMVEPMTESTGTSFAERERLVAIVDGVLDREVRHLLDSHAGNVRVRSVSASGVVDLVFDGACTSCPALPATLHTAVAPVLRKVPGVTDVRTSNVNISRAAADRLLAITKKPPTTKEGVTDE